MYVYVYVYDTYIHTNISIGVNAVIRSCCR